MSCENIFIIFTLTPQVFFFLLVKRQLQSFYSFYNLATMKKQLLNNGSKVLNFGAIGQFLIIYLLIFNCAYPSVLVAQNVDFNTQQLTYNHQSSDSSFIIHNASFNLIIEPIYGNNKLEMNTYLPLPKGDSVQITLLKFYLSNIELLNDKTVVWREQNSVHLMDLEDANSFKVPLNVPKSLVFNSIKINLGIDSLTNVSGALGGDLDPTKGMYWAWQSGYVNFKLEGKSPICPTRKHEFQFHLGGYLAPNYALQTIDFQLNKRISDNITLQLNIKDFLSHIDLKQQNNVMIPSEQAVLLAQKIAKLFIFKSSN